MMRLYLVRHGEAEGQVTTDAARALTARGRDEVARLWTWLVGQGVAPRRLINSPYARARQTADIIAARFPGVAREELDLITPEGDPLDVLDWLLAQRASDSWVLVSHMPLVDLLCGCLTDGARYPFAVGSTACLEVDVLAPGGARLIWHRSPTEV